MELPDETFESLSKNTILYLEKIAENVPHRSNILKSYYASKLRAAQSYTQIYVEKTAKKRKLRCSKCCLKLAVAGTSASVKPFHQNKKFTQKVLRKVHNNSRCTRYQLKYMKKTQGREGTQLVTKCEFCKKQSVQYFPKPVKIKPPEQSPDRKKKRSKKDKLCGLHVAAVAQVQAPKTFNKNIEQRIENMLEAQKLNVQNNLVQSNKTPQNKINIISVVDLRTPTGNTTKRPNRTQAVKAATPTLKQVQNAREKQARVQNKLANMLKSSTGTPKSKTGLTQFLSSL